MEKTCSHRPKKVKYEIGGDYIYCISKCSLCGIDSIGSEYLETIADYTFWEAMS